MKHIIFIDDLEKLVIKKDSSLFFAITLQTKNVETYLLFEKDFSINTESDCRFKVQKFEGRINQQFYVEDFKLKDSLEVKLEEGDVFHMRLDPPFDTRYLKYLWMEKYLEDLGVKVINKPESIAKYNEKMMVYSYKDYCIPTYIGSSVEPFLEFLNSLLEKGIEECILKPMDLYQGIGVEKVNITDLKNAEELFKKKVKDYEGTVLAQPFMKEVYQGELRSFYYKSVHIGTIKKTPPEGSYLANIAQGAKYEKVELNEKLFKMCNHITSDLLNDGIYWVAFDLLGDKVSEVNVTCPGLVVELSSAHQENLVEKMIEIGF